MDVPRHGNLKHIIDNQIPGQQNEQQHSHKNHHRGRVQILRQLRPGVTPVDPGGNVILSPGFTLITMIGQDFLNVRRNRTGAVFQHHIQIPGAGHLITAGRRYPNLLQYGINPAFRDENVVGNHRLIVFPPAAEGKGLGGFVTVYVKGNGKFRPQFRLDAQQLQHMGIGCSFISSLLGQAALHRVAVHPVGLVGIGVADFHMIFVEGNFCGHSQETPQTPLGDQRIVFQCFKLLFRQVLKGTMAPAPGLAKVVLLDALVNRQSNGKQGSKQSGSQGNGQNGHQIPGAVGKQ